MNTTEQPVAIVTGASSGIGLGAAGYSADEEATFRACCEHFGGPRGSTKRRRARTFGGAVEVADAGCE